MEKEKKRRRESDIFLNKLHDALFYEDGRNKIDEIVCIQAENKTNINNIWRVIGFIVAVNLSLIGVILASLNLKG